MKQCILILTSVFISAFLFAQNSDSAQFYFKKGVQEKNARRYLVASTHFNKSISLNSKDINTYIENGKVNLEMRKIAAAQDNFEKAYQIDPDNQLLIKELALLYFDNHQFAKAIEFAQKCKVCSGADRIIAMSNYYLEDYNKAIPGLQKVLAKNPNDAEATYILGKSFVETDEYSKAIPQFERAITLDTSHNSWMYELGLIYFNGNDYKNALNYFNSAAVAGYPQSNDFTENLGFAYLYSGDFNNGIKYLNTVIAKKPNSKELLTQIAFAFYKNRRYEDALNYYQKLIEKDSKDARSLYMAGLCFQRKGEKDKGQAMCNKAIEMDPALNNLRQKQMGMGL